MALDLNNIKEQAQTILQAANTTTGSPIDLSRNMTRRVNQILKTNIERIPVQASIFPAVTCYIETKTVDPGTMARTQSNAVRDATIDVKVVGMVWNTNFQTIDEDPADEDVENLMENIEEVFRSNPTLGISEVRWSRPTDVTYHSGTFDEETHMRVGIMNLELRIAYRGE